MAIAMVRHPVSFGFVPSLAETEGRVFSFLTQPILRETSLLLVKLPSSSLSILVAEFLTTQTL